MKNIPVLFARGISLAEAYENALVELYQRGGRMKTQYDKPDDPESIDATMNITIEEPLTDPMIHKAFPGSISDLREYVIELEGKKDSWVKNLNDPKDTRWEYTYHGRLANYGTWKELQVMNDCSCQYTHQMKGGKGRIQCEHMKPESISCGKSINQINFVIDKLVKQPFTRQAQMITWIPTLDLDCYDPPCLQSIWCRIMEEDGVWYLNTNIRFRSNDAWGAYFMNSFGLTMFLKDIIAKPISEKSGKEVKLGRINWQADSWHIYGKDIKQAKERFFDRAPTKEGFEDRVYNFYDTDIQEMYYENDKAINDKIEEQDKKYK